MNERSKPWWMIAIWLTVASLAPAASEWLLRIDLNVGDSHRFAISNSQSVKMDMGEMTQDVENTSRIEFLQTVIEELSDGSFVLDTSYERVQSEMRVGEMRLEFDTANPEPSQHPMARMQQVMIGKHFSVTMTPRGEVRSVAGTNEIFDSIAEMFSDDRTIQGTLDTVKQGFGDEAMMSMMQQVAVMFPEQAVSAGDTWQNEVTLPNPALGELRIKSDYRIAGPGSKSGSDCLEIAVAMTIEFGNEGQMFAQLSRLLGTELDIDVLNASGEGTLCMDPATGLVIDSQMQQVMEMDVSVGIPSEGEAEGQTMELHALINQQFGIELLD